MLLGGGRAAFCNKNSIALAEGPPAAICLQLQWVQMGCRGQRLAVLVANLNHVGQCETQGLCDAITTVVLTHRPWLHWPVSMAHAPLKSLWHYLKQLQPTPRQEKLKLQAVKVLLQQRARHPGSRA